MAKTEKVYRVIQNEGKITWRIEELWDGGVKRDPFGSRESAIIAEKKIAEKNGFIDELILEETEQGAAIPEATMLADSFSKDEEGNWQCIKPCAINIENREIVLSEGTKFTEGQLYSGVDVAKWLNERYKK